MSGLKTIITNILLFATLTVAAQQPAGSAFAGLDGRGIVEHLRSDFRPQTTVSTDEAVRVISSYARHAQGGYVDYFSAHNVASISDLQRLAVVPLKWWESAGSDLDAVKADLHNIVPANSQVAANRSDYPPGTVTETVYTNGFWRSGIGMIDDIETNFYEPADKFKGDFARIYMYMAAVYPQTLWSGRAPMVYLDGYYPLLTTYGRNTLMKWHREDPVDDFERDRDSAIASAQGSGNPFVAEPELAEYIWGIHSGETYMPDGEPDTPDNPDEPDEPDTPDDPSDEPIMLKARYSVAEDGRIDLRSPYIAAESSWTIDGNAVSGTSIRLDGLSLGRHELRYTNDRSRGKLIITVEP